jgi:hypothetical protein
MTSDQTRPGASVANRRWFDRRQVLPREDADHRLAAFIYGNVLVLAGHSARTRLNSPASCSCWYGGIDLPGARLRRLRHHWAQLGQRAASDSRLGTDSDFRLAPRRADGHRLAGPGAGSAAVLLAELLGRRADRRHRSHGRAAPQRAGVTGRRAHRGGGSAASGWPRWS